MTTDCTHKEAQRFTGTLVNTAGGWRWCEGCGCLVRFKQEIVVAEVLRPMNQRPSPHPQTQKEE